MTLSRRQALQLAAFGLLQGSALAQGQEPSHRYFGGFENDPTGEKHDTTRWAMLPILGVLCTVTWKQSPTDKWTWFRGLKQGYAVGKNVLLKDEWQDLWVVGGRRLFGRLFGKEVDKTIWEIPLTRKGKDLKLGKPVATNYTTISMGATCCGIQKESLIDWFDRDGEVIVTLHNALTTPRPYGAVYSVELRDPSGIPVMAMMDGKGQLVSPLLPEVKQFIYTKTRSDGGWSEYPLMAVPLNAEKTRFFPLDQQGQLPTDALKVRGYYPNRMAMPATGEPGPITSGPVLWKGWLKEYELEEGPAYGWVSEDLKTETGIVWRSIREIATDSPGMIGQLLDGTWMVYVFAAPSLRSAGHPYHQPLLDAPTATREEALRQFGPAYQEKIVKPREEARKKQAELDAAAFKKRQEEWKKQGNPNGPTKPSGHVYTAPSSASWVYKPQPASTSPGLGQYLKDLYEYGRGRDWKPVYR